jgi:hypothetical protein
MVMKRIRRAGLMLALLLWAVAGLLLWRELPPAVTVTLALPGHPLPEGVVREGSAWVIVKETAQHRSVTLDAAGQPRQGIAPGETVVVDPPPGLADGMPVRMRAMR